MDTGSPGPSRQGRSPADGGRRVTGTIESLQAGRAIAASLVVFGHAGRWAVDFGGPFTGDTFLTSYGYIGVDFFFVLSGFIIYHSTVARERSLGEYAVARFRRVYLPYWPIGILMALLYLALPGVSAADRQWSWLPTLTLLPVDSLPALSVAWTLKHEILFYTLFALFYFSRMLPLGLAIWAFAILVSPDHVPFDRINFEFFMGIAAAIAFHKRMAHPILIAVAVIPLALWVMSGAVEDYRLLTGAMFALLIAPIAQLESEERFRVPKWLLLLGGASYSLYLIHPIVIAPISRIVPGPYGILFVGLPAAFAAGLLYHFVIEKPVVSKRANPEVVAPLEPGESYGSRIRRFAFRPFA